jgi:hypothetical protein
MCADRPADTPEKPSRGTRSTYTLVQSTTTLMRSTVTLVRTVLDSQVSPPTGQRRPRQCSALTAKTRALHVQFLLVGLITAMVIGVLYPATGVWLGEQPLTKLAPAGALPPPPTSQKSRAPPGGEIRGPTVHPPAPIAAGIFFISGLKLRTSEARRALGNARAMIWGVLSTLVFTCALGVQLATLAPALPVAEFQRGLAVFLCMPCTITSGAALAAQARGPPRACARARKCKCNAPRAVRRAPRSAEGAGRGRRMATLRLRCCSPLRVRCSGCSPPSPPRTAPPPCPPSVR